MPLLALSESARIDELTTACAAVLTIDLEDFISAKVMLSLLLPPPLLLHHLLPPLPLKVSNTASPPPHALESFAAKGFRTESERRSASGREGCASRSLRLQMMTGTMSRERQQQLRRNRERMVMMRWATWAVLPRKGCRAA